MVMGGFGVIFMPKKISTSTTLDFLEIYVTLLKFFKFGIQFDIF